MEFRKSDSRELLTLLFDLLKGISRSSLTFATYSISFIYALILCTQGYRSIDDATLLIILLIIGFTLSFLYHKSRPEKERKEREYKKFHIIAFFCNTAMSIGACLYVLHFFEITTLTLPDNETMSILYQATGGIIFAFSLPFSSLFFFLPIIFLLNTILSKAAKTLGILPDNIGKYSAQVAVVCIAIYVFILMQNFEELFSQFVKIMPYLIGSIPFFWIYFFIITPIQRLVISK